MRVSPVIPILLSASLCGAQAPSLRPDSGRSIRDNRGGGGRAMVIESRILHERRRIDVAVPASWVLSAPTRRYPVTIVLDGESSLAPAAAVADELSRNGQIPESIIVAIENTDRLRDLTPPGISVSGSSRNEGGNRFLDFIEQELLPEIDRQFRGGAPRSIIGHSSGGILVTYAAATRSTYRTVIALDTPVHLERNWLAEKLVARASTAKTPLRYASYEARFGWTDATWKKLTDAAPATWVLHREKLPSESHESIPFLGMYLGMREVFRDYSMLAAPVAPTTSILPYYDKVSASLGATVLPPKRLLTNVVEDLLMEGRGAAARDAYTLQLDGYGEPSNSTELTRQIAEAALRPPPTETIESLQATPFPTPAEAAAWIGEWRGNTYMNAEELGSKPPEILRISVVDGHVQGESIFEPEPGVRMVEKWTYLKLTPTGMTFGFMNGMRPRGMLMHEGTLKNGQLMGRMRFGGINFTYPAGMTPPEIKFAFRKVR